MHTDADPLATAGFKGQEGADDWHVHAWGLVSWPQIQGFTFRAVVMGYRLVCAS